MTTLLKNRYQIERQLGSGGFGDTFLAQDTDLPSRRRCVIKQLKPVTNDPQVYQIIQERFKREAVILEKLGNANNHIPSLYAYFEQDNQFYLVQEWIDGVTLTEKIQQTGVLNESTVKDILHQCLITLESVHHQGIIHRDIKPDNIILRASDNQPVLIDFGAVKETMGTVLTPSGNQTSSIIIGTPGFMPSEQSIGRPVFSSDLYSLALTAIFLLTGKFPRDLPTDLATGAIRWRQYTPYISPEFAAVLDKAIQSHIRDRFLTAREMIDALGLLRSNVPTAVQSNPITSTVVVPAQGKASRLEDWQKSLIMGSVIGFFTLAGLIVVALILKQPTTTTTASSPTPEAQTSPIVTPVPSPIETPISQPTPTPQIEKPSPEPAFSVTGYCTSLPAAGFGGRRIVNDRCTITKINDDSYELRWSNGEQMYINLSPPSIDGNNGQLIGKTATSATVSTQTRRVGFCWNCSP